MNSIISELQSSVLFILVPTLFMLLGCFLAMFRTPSAKLTSFVQHFAAGVVLAAVVDSLMPKILHSDASPWIVAVFFLAGVALMLSVKAITERFEQVETAKSAIPWAYVLTIMIDLLVDGLLIGIATAAGKKSGLMISIALTIEILFLGLSSATVLAQRAISKSTIAWISLLQAAMIVVGVVLGLIAAASFTGQILIGMISFGVAALLYLVVEELLVKCHEVEETPILTSSFFIGFLIILLLGFYAR